MDNEGNKKSAIDLHNTISAEQAYNLIKRSCQALIADPSQASKLPPILLRGAPGVGKSTIVQQVAKDLGIGFVDIRLAQREPCDLRGLPVPNDETKSVDWYVTGDLPRDPDSKGILFFDEITSADKSLQVASYELILDRRLGKLYKVPDGWFIVAAGNRVTDRAVATAMSSALANRLMHFELDANAEDWYFWAIAHGLNPSVTGFIKYRPNLLFKMKDQNLEQGWPSPRSWERVSNIIPQYGDDEDLLRSAVYGLVGNQAGVEFMEFHKIQCEFDDVLEILTDPKKEFTVPDKADRLYAFTSAVSYLLWSGKNEDDDKLRVSGLYRVAMKLSSDFATMLVKAATLGNARVPRLKAVQYIAEDPGYEEFQKKFGKQFAKKYKL